MTTPPRTPGPPAGDVQGDVGVEDTPSVRKPRQFRVLLHNDDFTTMEFVVEVLVKFFRKNQTEAVQIMLTVHHSGVGVCGLFPRDVAEAKVQQVTEHARANGHPLKCTMEPA